MAKKKIKNGSIVWAREKGTFILGVWVNGKIFIDTNSFLLEDEGILVDVELPDFVMAKLLEIKRSQGYDK